MNAKDEAEGSCGPRLTCRPRERQSAWGRKIELRDFPTGLLKIVLRVYGREWEDSAVRNKEN